MLVLALALGLGGCAGFQLHDAEREKLAQGAKKSFDAADVESTIAAARANQAALTEAEVAQARRTVEARRNFLLDTVAGDQECAPAIASAAAASRPVPAPAPAAPAPTPAPSRSKPPFYGRFLDCIDRELHGLIEIPAGTATKTLVDGLRRAVATMEVFSDGMAVDRGRVRILFKGLELPVCAPRESLPPTPPPALLEDALRRARNEPLDPHYSAFVRKCEQYQKAFKEIAQQATGRHLATALQEWMIGRTELKSARQAVTDLKGKYQKALKDYADAVAELEKGDTREVREAVGKALAGLKEASEAFEKLGGALGIKELSAERLEQLDVVIAALKDGKVDPEKSDPGAGRAAGVVAALPTFADRAIDIARRRKAPLLGPLILEKELHRARLTAATRQVVRAEERVAWLERRLEAQRDRAIRLLAARERLERVATVLASDPACNNNLDCGRQRLPAGAVQAFSDAVPAGARLVLRQAMAEYADSFSVEAVAAAETEYRLVGLEYETALDRSEDAVREWQALIAMPIDRLIAYYGSGIRPAEVAALVVQFLGLASIGAGVNR